MTSRIVPAGRGVMPYLLGGKVRSFLGLAALGVVLAACANTGTVKDLNVKDWVGANERQLLATWGRPHHSYPMVAGGKMIGYQFSDNTVEWIKSHPHTRVRNCMVNFETDARGTILDATATGTTCTIGAHDQMHPKKS
jgi:hypothetical protein